jgi:hypothetical protein
MGPFTSTFREISDHVWPDIFTNPNNGQYVERHWTDEGAHGDCSELHPSNANGPISAIEHQVSKVTFESAEQLEKQ